MSSRANQKDKNPVTMRDVAKAAGVSRMTVSRALRKDGAISGETRNRVLDVVREMNYVPDQMAGSLTTKRSGFIGVLVPSLNNLHFAQTIQSLTEVLEPMSRQILLGHTDYSKEREERLVEDMLKRRPEAIVLSFDGHTDRSIALLKDAGIPVIELWERPEVPIDHTIGFSNRKAAAEMTHGLIERGYRNIAFLGEEDDAWTRGAERRAGFVSAMREVGLPSHRIVRIGKPPLSIEDGAAGVHKLLQTYPDTDCIFCVSDLPAFGALSSLSSLGKSVPDDIGIAGFGNFEVSRFATPDITTVVVDPQKIGKETGNLISNLLSDGLVRSAQTIEVPAELSFRGSTRSNV